MYVKHPHCGSKAQTVSERFMWMGMDKRGRKVQMRECKRIVSPLMIGDERTEQVDTVYFSRFSKIDL